MPVHCSKTQSRDTNRRRRETTAAVAWNINSNGPNLISARSSCRFILKLKVALLCIKGPLSRIDRFFFYSLSLFPPPPVNTGLFCLIREGDVRVYILKTHSYVRELYTGSIPGFTTTRTHVACDTHTRTVSGRRSEHVLQSKAGTHTYFSLSLSRSLFLSRFLARGASWWLTNCWTNHRRV